VSVPRFVATHEAGHAVARVLLDLPFTFVLLRDDWRPDNPRGVRGVVHSCRDDLKAGASLLRFEDEIVATYAGPIAQARQTKRSYLEAFMGGGMSDYRNADAFAEAAGLSQAKINDLWDVARFLVRDRWDLIQEVADALLGAEDLLMHHRDVVEIVGAGRVR
jgi:hypothetical protein